MPFCKFFFRDWLADLQLRQCSPLARAVWADMLCVMGMSAHYGFLETAEGGAMGTDEIARLTSNRVEDVKAAFVELERGAVFSRDERGVIYSRRMVKDRAKHNAKRNAGAKGGRVARANAQANAGANAQAQSSEARNQKPDSETKEGEREGGAGADARERRKHLPATWAFAAAFDALAMSGKFPALTPELLDLVARKYPRARLAENLPEVIEAARSIAGPIGDPHAWLSRRLSAIEARELAKDAGPGHGRKRGRSARPDGHERREFPEGGGKVPEL